MVKTVLRLTIASCMGLTFSAAGQGQQRDDLKNLQEDISSLKKDVKNIGEKQQQIVDQLNELMRLLRANASATTPAQQPAKIDVQGVPSQGDSGATVAIIEYGDFECPACGTYWREVYPQIEANYLKTGKIEYFFRDLPLAMHSHAIPAARLAHCAGEQGKYWEMHDKLFASQTVLAKDDTLAQVRPSGLESVKLDQCFASDKYSDQIRKSVTEAQGMGIMGTPTFFVGTIEPNGEVINVKRTIPGAYPYLIFKSYLDDLLVSRKQ